MLTAIAVCLELQAAKVLVGCTAAKPPSARVAAFASPDGRHGSLVVVPPEKWDEAVKLTSAGLDGGTQAMSAWAHVVVVFPGEAPGIVWWTDSVDHQCEAMAARDEAKAQIAKEKSNPSGVVNLVRLHDLGEQQQAAEDALRDYGAIYSKAAGRMLPAFICGR